MTSDFTYNLAERTPLPQYTREGKWASTEEEPRASDAQVSPQSEAPRAFCFCNAPHVKLQADRLALGLSSMAGLCHYRAESDRMS